jgi:hypothetical protein
MATRPGLSFANSMFSGGETPDPFVNPYTLRNPAADTGSDALQRGLADMAVLGQAGMAAAGQFTMPQMRQPRATGPSIAISGDRTKMFVQGQVFDVDDYARALEVEQLLSSPATGLPTAGDWQPLDLQSYSEYTRSIKQPTLGRLASEGFSTGAAQLRQLAGSALQLAGAEEFGGGIVERAERDIQKLAPFGREFTDIDSGRGAIEWFVATLGTQGPMLLESIAAAGAGAIAGTAAAGPGLGTAGGLVAGTLGKKAFKEKVLQAAENYRNAKAKGIAPSPDDVKTLRSASAVTGALAASFGSSYIVGAGDIYGEMRDQGVTAEDVNARMTALAGAVPYAALESLTEFALAAAYLWGRWSCSPSCWYIATSPWW